ncbi:SWI/SNF complex subunit SWI3C [Linum perenne]
MPAASSDGRGKWKRRKRKSTNHSDSDPDDSNDDASDEPTALNQPAQFPNRNPAVEVLADGGVRISDFPPVTKRVVNRPHGSVIGIVAAERANLFGGNCNDSSTGLVPSLENLSCGQMAALSAVPKENAGGADDCRFVITPPQIAAGKGVVKRFGDRAIIVPMYSDWFAPNIVHRLERQVVPKFFSGKSSDHTPESYMECRNHIVAKYMEDPEKRLAFSDCQGLVPGIGEEELSRIVRFLDHWGIINYCAAAPSRETWSIGSYLNEDVKGEVHVPSAALKSIDSLIKFDKPKCRLKAADIYSALSCRDDLSDVDNKIREQLSESCCNYCSCPLLAVYYQSQQDVDILLCCECFHDGRFILGHSSLDFVKVESAKDYGNLDGESWTDQETFLLLEAVEIYNENWNGIADHVGSKSKAQCILHFLRLPVEDGLLENIEVPSVANLTSASNGDGHTELHSVSNGSRAQDDNSESRLPFANSENPVMALVGFLASAIGPRIAAACAHASLAALSEDSRQGNNHGETSDTVLQNDPGAASLSTEKVEAAARAGLAAAATKGKLFADHEEREIQRNSAIIINHQLKRLELKLKQFAEMETILLRECDQVEKMSHRFAAERARIQSIDTGSALSISQMNRPQVIPATSLQPSISGYGSSQQVHPQIPFMQRGQQHPSMFPLGPRLPLSAIQPSSSASAMFNPSGNSQPNLNQILRSVSGSSSGLG